MKSSLKISGFLSTLCTVIALLTFQGCEINGEVPGAEYFLNKEWKIDKVEINRVEETQVDLSLFRLTFNDDFTFDEIQIEGQEATGTWRLDNNATILGLTYSDGTELRFIIMDFQIRELKLRVIQSEEKIGSLDILYYLKPVRI